MRRPVALLLGPHRGAVSGVSTHLNLLLASRLAGEYSLVHFQVGSEGREESVPARVARLLVSPLLLAAAILVFRARVVHLNTSLNARAYWRDLAYMLVSKACGASVLYQVHGGALPLDFLGRPRILASPLRWTLRLPEVIVVLAYCELDAYRRFVPGQRVVLLPNSIDCVPYARLEREQSIPGGPLRLVYIGRLAREKGLYEALRALALARGQGANVRLAIAGSGPADAGLRRLALELGLAREVSFVGPVFGEAKLRFLGGADAFLFASHGEGLPYALLESMAAGVPVVATRVGAVPDIVIDGVHGLLVPQRDEEAIARAVMKLANDRDLLARMSSTCKRRIANCYSLDRLAEQFCGLYSDLCSAKRVKALSRF